MNSNVSQKKQSVLKRTLFSVFLVLILALVFATPAAATEYYYEVTKFSDSNPLTPGLKEVIGYANSPENSSDHHTHKIVVLDDFNVPEELWIQGTYVTLTTKKDSEPITLTWTVNNAGFGMFNVTSYTNHDKMPCTGNLTICNNGTGKLTLLGNSLSGKSLVNVIGESENNLAYFYMEGGCLKGNTAEYGGGVYLDRFALFEMSGDAKISGNKAEISGGGVYNALGLFYMSEKAEITDLNTAMYGGGVENCYYFEMFGEAKITNNKAKYDGGGVDNYQSNNGDVGAFVMRGKAEISGNKAENSDGGVANGGGVANYGVFAMADDAKIYSNTATDFGGGVSNYYVLTMEDNAAITGNTAETGSGVYHRGELFSVQDNVKVKDNTGDNVYLSNIGEEETEPQSVADSGMSGGESGGDSTYPEDSTEYSIITINGELTTPENIGVTHHSEDETLPVDVVNGVFDGTVWILSEEGEIGIEYPISDEDIQYFFADNPNLMIVFNEEKKTLQLVERPDEDDDEDDNDDNDDGGPRDDGNKGSSTWLQDPSYIYLSGHLENGGTVQFELTDLVLFYVTIPEGTARDVILIAKNGLPTPDGKEVIAVADITVTPPLADGEEAIITVKIPKFILDGFGITAEDIQNLTLYHLVNGEWVKMDVTVTVDEKGDVIIEARTTSFSPFAVVLEEGGELKPIETPTTPTESPASILGVLAGLGAVAALRRK